MEQTLIEILAKLHTMPTSFPERESDEYDAGYAEALRDVRHIIKDYLLKAIPPLPLPLLDNK